jgi:hypothetical protein
MAHFAELDADNYVIRVLVVDNDKIIDDEGSESEKKGIEYLRSIFGGRWVQTSYNCRFRGTYAGPGYRYDKGADVFIPPDQE